MREAFEHFLGSIPLAAYRKNYLPIKIVEMDLDRSIHALDLLYETYWHNQTFLPFEDFYAAYLRRYQPSIDAFQEKIGMCKECFAKGLEPRIYRTWASIITQIHAGYVAESVFGEGSVQMSTELDHKGADFQVTYRDHILNYQVKKETLGREARQPKPKAKNPLPGEFIDLAYAVPASSYFDQPKKKNGEWKLPYKRFMENPYLRRMDNGFVVFTSTPFEEKKRELDKLSESERTH